MENNLYNQLAEESVLASCLVSKEALNTVTITCSEEYFANPHYKKLFNVIVDTAKSGIPVDVVTISNELIKDKKLIPNGVLDSNLLHRITSELPCAANVSYYIDILREYCEKREWLKLAKTIEQLSTEHGDIKEIREVILKKITETTSKVLPKPVNTALRIIKPAV